ncbi:hypothetical protein QZH41_000300 [Actinostola sp. cb2023]|nr:hypothetical protein QZH41_000300 [Actinostola sp. cb2023]
MSANLTSAPPLSLSDCSSRRHLEKLFDGSNGDSLSNTRTLGKNMDDKGKTSSKSSTSKENIGNDPTNTPSLSRVQVKSPGTLEVSESQHTAKTWKLWKQMWGNYAIVTNLDSQREEYRKAVFLCTIGQSALEIYNSFQYADDLFNDEIGTLPGEVKLTVIEDATPVVCPPKRLPVEIKDQMTVATKKSGELRICLDPRSLNKVLKREHYQLPVLEDTLHDLAKAKLFSKLDLKHGYWHCVLDEPSSILTTFATPFGRYKWKRLPFGLSVSSEIFQKRLIQALEGLPSTTTIADDILLYGKGEQEKDAEKDHDDNLTKLLERCQEKGIRLNKGKAVLKVKQLDFMGHLVTSEGLKPDPNKVEAIVKLQTPTDKQGVERLNGAVNYLAKFLPKLSQVMAPIRQLTHKDVEWHWDAVQDRAFEEIKQLVTQAPVLAYYDPQKELVIQCDASSKGLGAVLLQEERPVAYASRCLTDAETRYATIEKEMLAVVFALEKWHQFTYGRAVQVCTDHKPLVSINQKSLDKAPRRLQGIV